MIVTFLFASILSWLIFRALKFLTAKTKSFVDDRILAIAKPPVYYSLLITGFSAGINRMTLSDKLSDYFIFGFKSLGAIIWMIALIRFSKII
jgi:MscS family membrane protein